MMNEPTQFLPVGSSHTICTAFSLQFCTSVQFSKMYQFKCIVHVEFMTNSEYDKLDVTDETKYVNSEYANCLGSNIRCVYSVML